MKRSKAKIQAVATDMASGYISAVLEHLPKADLVLDHFHLVKWFNENLALLRRQLFREATEMHIIRPYFVTTAVYSLSVNFSLLVPDLALSDLIREIVYNPPM